MTEINLQSFEDTSVAFSSKSDAALRRMHFIFASMNNTFLVTAGTSTIKIALKLGLPVASLIKNTIFSHFCGGESIEDSESTVRELAEFNIGTILDYSVEGETTEAGFEKTAREIIKTIEKAQTTPSIPFCVFKVTGLASGKILEKRQKGILSEEEHKTYEKVVARVDNICKKAYDAKVRILIDGEESWMQNTIDEIAYEMMRKYNSERPIVFNTYQMYRKDMLAKLKQAFQFAATHNHYLGAKLVRGAYMEKEREKAEEEGYPDPIQPSKEATDEDYNRALKYCLDNKQRIALCSGSHNEYSNYYLTVLMEKHGVKKDDERFYFAQLYGMSDNISYNLANAGYNVVKYVPYGPVKSVMPYLFRRAEENTSIAGQSSREYLLIKKELERRKNTRK